jgi:site-specific recombinase XerD
MNKEYPLLPLFEQYIRDSRNGKRVKADGTRIKTQTVDNYRYVLKLLTDFSTTKGFYLRIKPATRLNQRQSQVEKNYWKKFYRSFTDFLYRDKGCFDNYTGSVIKNIRSFFSYLNKDKLIITGDFYKSFHKKEEDIGIVTFLPEQLQFLIHDRAFEESLPKALRRTKDVMVVGCTVALRFSDLFNIRFRDIEVVAGNHYLSVRSIKMDTPTKVKLPGYVVEIVKKLGKGKRPSSALFAPISMNQFNKNLRTITKRTGWDYEVGKQRTRNGQSKELVKPDSKKTYLFCDLVSSHTMRRTAITTMLMLGMPENLVRKISGHAPHSKAFYRYVNFVQSYLDQEVDKVHSRLGRETLSS